MNKQQTPLDLAQFILRLAGHEERIEVDLAKEVVRLSEFRTACELLAKKWHKYANDNSGRHPWASETLTRCASELKHILEKRDSEGETTESERVTKTN